MNLGSSTTVREAIQLVTSESFIFNIDQFDCQIEFCYKTVDWGQKRGQGKRSGHETKGSMSDMTVRGEVTYTGVDNSSYINDGDNFDALYTATHCVLYQIARKFGCNHIEALVYACKKYKGQI